MSYLLNEYLIRTNGKTYHVTIFDEIGKVYVNQGRREWCIPIHKCIRLLDELEYMDEWTPEDAEEWISLLTSTRKAA